MVLKRCWLLPSFLGIFLLASSAAAVSLDDQPQEAFSLLAGQPDQIPGFAQLVIIEAVDLGGSQLLVKAKVLHLYGRVGKRSLSDYNPLCKTLKPGQGTSARSNQSALTDSPAPGRPSNSNDSGVFSLRSKNCWS